MPTQTRTSPRTILLRFAAGAATFLTIALALPGNAAQARIPVLPLPIHRIPTATPTAVITRLPPCGPPIVIDPSSASGHRICPV